MAQVRAEALSGVPTAHRGDLERNLRQLQLLQGEHSQPTEHKVYEKAAGEYELQLFDYPQPLTAAHLREAEEMRCVRAVNINFALRGTGDAWGALVVQMRMSAGRYARDVGDDDDDAAGGDAKRTRRHDAADESPGWIARLFSNFG